LIQVHLVSCIVLYLIGYVYCIHLIIPCHVNGEDITCHLIFELFACCFQ